MSELLTPVLDDFGSTIAVDVDNTLVRGPVLNARLVDWLKVRRTRGANLMLWSMRGKSYARGVAESSGCANLFQTFASKPGFVVDDDGWQWTRGSRVIHPGNL